MAILPVEGWFMVEKELGWTTISAGPRFACGPKAIVVVRQLAAGETLHQLSLPSDVSQA